MLRDKNRFKKVYPTSKGVIQKQIIFASINGFFEGVPNTLQNIFYYVSNRKIEFRKDFENSHFSVRLAPTTEQVFKIYIQKYGIYSNVANITLAANEKIATFNTIIGVNHIINPGEALYIEAPLTIDSNLTDISFSIFGDLLS